MTSAEKTISELAMLVRMLVSALKRYDVAHPVAAKATRLLADRGLLGTGLRQRQEYVQIDAETVARSAEYVARRLDAADMAPLPADGLRRGRSGQMIRRDEEAALYQAGIDSGESVPMSDGDWAALRAAALAVDGGPVIALDGGPGRGLVGPLWQFEPAMRAALPRLSAALGTTNGWALLSFLESAHGALDGRTPRQAIEQGETELVIQVAGHD